MQVGLECLGKIDVYLMGEVLMLARRSLESLGERSCLDISHMGFINGLLRDELLTQERRDELLKRVSERNMHELSTLCSEYILSETASDGLVSLTSLYGTYDETLGELRRISINEETDAALRELEDIWAVLKELGVEGDIKLDFSIVNDLSYYSGIIFQGYIDGVPAKVLSGGRYDKLVHKFGRCSGAIGFAVYLDLLERLYPPRLGPRVDVLLLYGDETSAEELAKTVSSYTAQGHSICVQRSAPDDVKHKWLVEM
jgi:ATP phosphoribosyltransferase regulatory subunit